LRYLSRYTHRIAISNRRLVSADEKGVTFKYKDYRIEGPGRYKTMTLATDELIRRFLIHVLPKGFHRIRHYGLLANGNRAANIAHARKLLAMPLKQPETAKATEPGEPSVLPRPSRGAGGQSRPVLHQAPPATRRARGPACRCASSTSGTSGPGLKPTRAGTSNSLAA
jgi:Putative transposase